MRYGKGAVEKRAKRLGLILSIWTPGDRYGTRYNFFAWEGPTGGLHGDYGTYCGASEAMAFLNGFERAQGHAAEVERHKSYASNA
jgi:hypothetical protein